MIFNRFFLVLALVVSSSSCSAQNVVHEEFPSSNLEIRKDIDAHRPLLGYPVPADIAEHLGASHMGGKYYLTDEPYIVEGARKISETGMKVFKIFLGQRGTELKGFPYNSNWNLPADASYEQLVSHPYVKQAFSFDFSTIILNVTDVAGRLQQVKPDFSDVYENIYELCVYLLKEYADRDVTFIIKNWEGDWVLRGVDKKNSQWMNNPMRERRIENMISWIETRQRAVTQARQDVRGTRAEVYLAVEANKVMDAMKGVDGVANKVIPKVEVDMVSWSSYDGMSTAADFYKGVRYLQEQLRPTPYMKGKKQVMIGELGIPENLQPDNIETRLDEFVGVCLALKVPYLVYWEVYCNETLDRSRREEFFPPCEADELKGLWLYRPDGSKSESCKYFEEILKSAGNVIKTD